MLFGTSEKTSVLVSFSHCVPSLHLKPSAIISGTASTDTMASSAGSIRSTDPRLFFSFGWQADMTTSITGTKIVFIFKGVEQARKVIKKYRLRRYQLLAAAPEHV